MNNQHFPAIYGNRFAPVTFSVGLLNVSLEQTCDALENWLLEIQDSVEVETLRGGLVENIGRLEPLTTGFSPRTLLIATANKNWTAIFDCGIQGSDPVSAVGHLSRTIQCQGLAVTSISESSNPATGKGVYGAIQFQMFGPLENTDFLNYVRTLSLIQDGNRWRFDANGTIQPFESTAAYNNRRTTARFTPEMLISYCSALDVEPFDDHFYVGPSALVTSTVDLPTNLRSASISEIQTELGIKHTT